MQTLLHECDARSGFEGSDHVETGSDVDACPSEPEQTLGSAKA